MAKKNTDEFNTLVLDIGNSDLKGEVNGQRFSLASNYSRWGGLRKLELSDVIAPFGGFAVYDYNNNSAATQYKFTEVGGNNLLGDGDKLRLYKTIVQGCCGSVDNDLPWRIVLSYWDRYKLQEPVPLIKGVHSVCVNGKDKEIHIADVHVVAEGAGADVLYRKDFSGTLTTIDIGYNTLILRSTSNSGLMEHHPEDNHGVREIVTSLANSPALEDLAGGRPTDRAVINAIKNNGVLRSNTMQTPDIDINHLIKPAVENWMQGPFFKLLRRYPDEVNQSSAIWLIGGGANLLSSFTEGTNIHVPEAPEFVNLQGMSLLV